MLKHKFGYLSRKIKLGFKTRRLCLEIENENEILPLIYGVYIRRFLYGGLINHE